MKKAAKSITVVPYAHVWPRKFHDEAKLIQSLLGGKSLAVHHIGSTAVPGLCAKPDIDILCVVDMLDNSLSLQALGYEYKGEMNIPLCYFFSKNTDQAKFNLHVVEKDHGFIHLNLIFRDYLRFNEAARLKYDALKKRLLECPSSYERTSSGFSRYNLGKDRLIKDLLDGAGFNSLCVNFCMHAREWEEYHRIRKNLIFQRANCVYDRSHPTLSDPNHYHFVLYKGTTIIGTAHIEFLSETESALRPFAIDTPFQKKGYGSQFLRFLEKWLRQKNQRVAHLHAHPSAKQFYERLGYQCMQFKDGERGLSEDSIDMGKIL